MGRLSWWTLEKILGYLYTKKVVFCLVICFIFVTTYSLNFIFEMECLNEKLYFSKKRVLLGSILDLHLSIPLRYILLNSMYGVFSGLIFSCSVLRHTCPVSPSFSADYYAEHGRRLIDALETAKVIREDFASVIFHVFSQHGCSLFEAIWTLLGSTPDGLRLKSDLTKAVVFDRYSLLVFIHCG